MTISDPVRVVGEVGITSLPDDGIAGMTELPPSSNIIGATLDAGFAKTTEHFRAFSADAQAGVDITAAPIAGQKRVMVDYVIATAAAMTVSLAEETSGTVIHGPYPMAANDKMQITVRSTPMSKLPTADKKYQVLTSAAGNITVETWTYSEA